MKKMNKVTAFFALALLAGCAQQTTTSREATANPEVTKPETATPDQTAKETDIKEPAPAVAIAPVPQPKPVVKPEAKPKPKPQSTPVQKPAVTKTGDGKLILGSEEWVWLTQPKQHIRAKVDSQAQLSTLGVSNIQAFERDGNDWVKFSSGGKSVELPVERWLKSKENDSKQAVVKLRAKLGDLNELTEFALTAGQGIVLGVNFIRDVAVVDGKRKFVQPKVK